MAQTILGALTTLNVSTHLDAMFTDLYGYAKNLVSDGSGNVFVGLSSTTFSSTRMEVLAGGTQNAFGAKTTVYGSAPLMSWNAAISGNNVFAFFLSDAAGDVRGSISYNRGGGLTAYNTTSDYRVKEVNGPIADSGAAIDALAVYDGLMHGATIRRPMFIAHEVAAVAPYAVTGAKDAVNADGTPLLQQMDTSALVPLLVAELQALRARVAALEAA